MLNGQFSAAVLPLSVRPLLPPLPLPPLLHAASPWRVRPCRRGLHAATFSRMAATCGPAELRVAGCRCAVAIVKAVSPPLMPFLTHCNHWPNQTCSYESKQASQASPESTDPCEHGLPALLRQQPSLQAAASFARCRESGSSRHAACRAQAAGQGRVPPQTSTCFPHPPLVGPIRNAPFAIPSPADCTFDDQTLALFTSSLFLAAMVVVLLAGGVTRAWGRRLSMLLGGMSFLIGGVRPNQLFAVLLPLLSRRWVLK